MIKDLKFAFACQSKTKVVKKKEDFYQEKYNYDPPQYGTNFSTMY